MMWVCSKCEQALPEDLKYCPLCGAEALKAERSGYFQCRRCNYPISESLQFCIHCGLILKGLISEEEKGSQEGICPACSAEVPEEISFCVACGEKL